MMMLGLNAYSPRCSRLKQNTTNYLTITQLDQRNVTSLLIESVIRYSLATHVYVYYMRDACVVRVWCVCICNCNGLFNWPAVIALYVATMGLAILSLICKMYAPCIMKEINNIYSHNMLHHNYFCPPGHEHGNRGLWYRWRTDVTRIDLVSHTLLVSWGNKPGLIHLSLVCSPGPSEVLHVLYQLLTIHLLIDPLLAWWIYFTLFSMCLFVLYYIVIIFSLMVLLVTMLVNKLQL